MKNLSYIKKSIYSGIVFFMTIMILSLAYAVIGSTWTSPATLEVNSGSGLTASAWNALLANFNNLDTRVATLTSNNTNIGERIIGVAPTNSISVGTAHQYLQKYIDLTPGIWQVSLMGVGDLALADSWNHNFWWLSSSSNTDNYTGFNSLQLSSWQASSGPWIFISGFNIVHVTTPTRLYVRAYISLNNNSIVSIRGNEVPVAIRIK